MRAARLLRAVMFVKTTIGPPAPPLIPAPLSPCPVKSRPASGQEACHGGWRVTEERGGDGTQEGGPPRGRRERLPAALRPWPARSVSVPYRVFPSSVAASPAPWRSAFRGRHSPPAANAPAWRRSAPRQHVCGPNAVQCHRRGHSSPPGSSPPTGSPTQAHRRPAHRDSLPVGLDAQANGPAVHPVPSGVLTGRPGRTGPVWATSGDEAGFRRQQRLLYHAEADAWRLR